MPDAGGAVLKYAGISHVGAGLGIFKLDERQFGWACTDGVAAGNAAKVQFLGQDIAAAEWHRVCGKGRAMLKLGVRGDMNTSRFTGFRQEHFKELRDHLKKHYGATLVEQPVSTEGWSWFDWSLDGKSRELHLKVGDKAGIDIPLGELSQVSTAGRSELNLEFQEDSCLMLGEEGIHEMRLFIPGGEGDADLTAEQLKDELVKRTGISTTDEVIARVSDITVVQPRGKHDFEFCQQAMKVRGKTQTYTIKYASIARSFLLDLPNDESALVLQLDQPVRQGHQMHNFLVLTFDKQRCVTVDLPKDMLKTLNMQAGQEHEVYSYVGKLIKQLSGTALIAPTTDFRSLLKDGFSCVRCSHKTQGGYLFPTKRSMIFVPRPVIWIRYDEIEGLEFRSNPMRKMSFDLIVNLRHQGVVELSQLERSKAEAVFNFFEHVKVRIINREEVMNWNVSQSSREKASSAVRRPSTNASSASSNKRPEPDPDAKDEEGEDDEDYEEADEYDTGSEDEDEASDEPNEKKAPPKKRQKQ